MSNSRKIYDGACFENSNLCGERHAIANMVLKESYKAKIKHIVVADPVPKKQKDSTTPCGACRQVISEFGMPNTTIICIQYIKGKSNWTFPKIEKYTLKKLYPHPYKPKEGLWNNWIPQ